MSSGPRLVTRLIDFSPQDLSLESERRGQFLEAVLQWLLSANTLCKPDSVKYELIMIITLR